MLTQCWLRLMLPGRVAVPLCSLLYLLISKLNHSCAEVHKPCMATAAGVFSRYWGRVSSPVPAAHSRAILALCFYLLVGEQTQGYSSLLILSVIAKRISRRQTVANSVGTSSVESVALGGSGQ